jgi:nanoRNase/pAp phosphatase (c-di-AMP/oligoRNAs hydrolase)
VALKLKERGMDVVVFDDDGPRADIARQDGIECVQALVSDPEAEGSLSGTGAFVMMDMDALRVDRLAKSFRRRFPKARIIAPDLGISELPFLETFTGDGQSMRIGLEAMTDAVVSAVEEAMAKRSTDALVEVLRGGGDGVVAIFTHDDPDPDAIAAGLGMIRLCKELGLEAHLYHGGELNRLQNRFFTRLIEAEMASMSEEEAKVIVQGASRTVLIDVAQPGAHNVLSRDMVPNVVLDHHSTNKEVCAADYSDVRPAVGSTSTMVTLHLQELGVTPDPRLAAALLFGIRTDTDHLRRNTSTADMRASAYLASLADQDLLDLVEHPPLPPTVMDVIGRGIVARRRNGDHLLTWCGNVASREDLPFVADFLLQEEDVAAVYVFGRVEDKVFISARSIMKGPHVGDIMKEALGDVGEGGGHATMAGGSVILRLGVGLDVDKWVQDDLFQAFLDAAGIGSD